MSTIKQFIADNMLRGHYKTADEKELESPLGFILWLAYQQYQRNALPKAANNHLQVNAAANEELG